jgi:hypothetical protein
LNDGVAALEQTLSQLVLVSLHTTNYRDVQNELK